MYLPGAWQLVFTEKTFQFLSFHLGISLGILWSSGINSRMNLPWKWNTKTDAVAWGGSCWQAHLWVLYIQWWVHLWHLRNEFPKSPRLPPRRESSEHLAGWYTRKKGGDQGAAPDKANQFMLFNDQSLSAVCCHMAMLAIPTASLRWLPKRRKQGPIRIYQQLVEDIPSWGFTQKAISNQQSGVLAEARALLPRKPEITTCQEACNGMTGKVMHPAHLSETPRQCWALCNGVLISEVIELRLALYSAASWPHQCRGSLSWKGKYFGKLLSARIVVVKLSVHNTQWSFDTFIAALQLAVSHVLPCSQAARSFWFFAHGICLMKFQKRHKSRHKSAGIWGEDLQLGLPACGNPTWSQREPNKMGSHPYLPIKVGDWSLKSEILKKKSQTYQKCETWWVSSGQDWRSASQTKGPPSNRPFPWSRSWHMGC